ncbi:SDR family NAD(P)-dependent oxidoreductase [Nocardioides nitrophenolicus]|uniref:SDR family NAD(P)-dependent oxidoreductase n=1 Tax=Nocardioides nitrophenolicus TaxID=60489 RepID=UPI00195B17D0|nr:SDR family oxidoreductase [Nocardioides nitrophenolicus]MBM7518164.1 NAD(P)-dependent dehydrogenase (short-subunit alcohol dehydrogenase family) [Nocardioides nitrophenolicus]
MTTDDRPRRTARLGDKVALVTGAAQGIGAAVAGLFLAEGARVACVDLNADRLRETWREPHDDRMITIAADVSVERDVVRAVTATADAFGTVDILVNVAGVAGPQSAAGETLVEDWDQTQAVNLRGTFLTVKHCLPHLVERRGSIVNIASALALVGWPQETAYGPSKAGVVQFTRGVALDYAPYVRSNCVCPGAVRTPMITEVLEGHPDRERALAEYGSIHPLTGRLAEPIEIAQAVLFLASDDASFVTGVALPVDGGFTAA